jgi:hypothetical protein
LVDQQVGQFHPKHRLVLAGHHLHSPSLGAFGRLRCPVEVGRRRCLTSVEEQKNHVVE